MGIEERTPPTGSLPPGKSGLAFVRLGSADAKGRRPVRAYMVPVERDGEKIDVPDGAPDPMEGVHEVFYETRVTGVVRVVRHAPIAPRSPSMWFVSVDIARRFGPGMWSMVGFESDRFDDGVIVDEMQFVTVGVDNESQVGAVTWSRDTGFIDQMYVAPSRRESHVARRLLNAAGAFHHTMGWEGVLRADGRRTHLGQAVAARNPRPQRVARHTELSPPMDPA